MKKSSSSKNNSEKQKQRRRRTVRTASCNVVQHAACATFATCHRVGHILMSEHSECRRRHPTLDHKAIALDLWPCHITHTRTPLPSQTEREREVLPHQNQEMPKDSVAPTADCAAWQLRVGVYCTLFSSLPPSSACLPLISIAAGIQQSCHLSNSDNCS